MKNTKWRIVELKADSSNSLTEQEILFISTFDSYEILVQTFKKHLVITQVISKKPDTSNYELSNNSIIYFRPGIDTIVEVILRRNKDTIVCRSKKGLLTTMVKIED